MKINLHLLRVFFTVAEQQSFSQAAQCLFISQPAVSKAVKALEQQLELPLIERGGSTRTVRLTENGRALSEHARGIFALERAAIDEMHARAELRHGKLTLGASTTIAGYWLPAHIAQFKQQFPSIQLRMIVGNTQNICHALIECDVDIAFVEGSVEDPRIDIEHWQDETLEMVAPNHLTITPNAAFLSQQTWLMRESGSGTHEVAAHIMKTGHITPSHIIELGSNEAIARAVAAGAGLAILPRQVVRELIMVGEVQSVPPAKPLQLVRPLYCLQLKARPSSPLVQAFHALLRQARPL